MFSPISERVSTLWADVTWKAAEIKQWVFDLGEERLRNPASFQGDILAASVYYSHEDRGLTPIQSRRLVAAVRQTSMRRQVNL